MGSMAASRGSLRCLARHLRQRECAIPPLAKGLSCRRWLYPSSALPIQTRLTDGNSSAPAAADSTSNSAETQALRKFSILQRCNYNSDASGSEKSHGDDDFTAPSNNAASEGRRTVPPPLRNYSPILSGFSVLPNPAVGVPAGLSPPSTAGSLNVEQLGREMSASLSRGREAETIQLFEDWLRVPDFQGQAKVANLAVYNLVLHAKLKATADPESLLQTVNEMEMNGLRPNTLSYNFLIRAYFRQRDSKMVEAVLDKMLQSGPEAHPNGDSYNYVTVLCALDKRMDAAMVRYRAMLQRGFVPSKTAYNELLLSATHLDRYKDATELLEDLKKRNIALQFQNVLDLAVTASRAEDTKLANLALGLFASSPASMSKPVVMDEGGMYHLLSTAARTGDLSFLDRVCSTVRTSVGDNRPASHLTYLPRIHAFSSAGDVDSAFTVLRDLEVLVGNQANADLELLSPFSSLRPLVLACSRRGAISLDAAYYKLADLHSSGQPVPVSAINCIIQGCANIWDYERAYQTFETIVSTFGLVPNVHSYNSLLDVFGKTRKMTEVLQVFSYMQSAGCPLDERTYTLLAEAHVVNRDPTAAWDVVKSMIGAGLVPERSTILKILRRYIKENNEAGFLETRSILKEFGLRDATYDQNKWKQVDSL